MSSKMARMLKAMDFEGCVYCGESRAEIERRATGNRLVLDHVRSAATGGSNRRENLVPSCCSCNAIKGAFGLEEFRVRVSWRIWSEQIPGLRPFTEPQLEFLRSRLGISKDALGLVAVVFYFESGAVCEALVKLSKKHGTKEPARLVPLGAKKTGDPNRLFR